MHQYIFPSSVFFPIMITLTLLSKSIFKNILSPFEFPCFAAVQSKHMFSLPGLSSARCPCWASVFSPMKQGVRQEAPQDLFQLSFHNFIVSKMFTIYFYHHLILAFWVFPNTNEKNNVGISISPQFHIPIKGNI